jgi:hypothetical protein
MLSPFRRKPFADTPLAPFGGGRDDEMKKALAPVAAVLAAKVNAKARIRSDMRVSTR